MRISIIGGSGFIGTHLINILKPDYKLSNLDKSPSKQHNDITIIGDIRNQIDINDSIKGNDLIILLAAEHKDNVNPSSLYYDVNVQGTKNVLRAMNVNGINRIVFFSSVAVYGFNKPDPGEDYPVNPENHYGKSKLQAEESLIDWYKEDPEKRSVTILRPTVVFGENNRGNVYNLINQMQKGRFIMVGDGKNKKSMTYVGNIVAFIKHLILTDRLNGYELYNFADKPDLTTMELFKLVNNILEKKASSIVLPTWIGLLGGYLLDIVSFITGRELSVSSVRIKKFCATTTFHSNKVNDTGFVASVNLKEAIGKTIFSEFRHSNDNTGF